jgi:hypothetical protein
MQTMIDVMLAIFLVWFVFVLVVVAVAWINDIILDPHRHEPP